MMRHIQHKEEEYRSQMTNMRQNYLSLQRKAEIGEVMMSEYASMAIGPDYQTQKGYHDAEMEAYAARRLDMEMEVQRCEQVHMEIAADDKAREMSRRVGVKKKEKERAAQSKSPIRSKAHGQE